MTSYVAPDLFLAGPTEWPFGHLMPQAYSLIFADPPWRFELYSDLGEEKSAQAHYETMTLDDIAALPVGDLARGDCILWLWSTAPMVPQQIEVGRRWGFEYVTQGVWVKTTKHGKTAFGTGYVLRNAHEPFLIFKRGNPKTAKNVRSVIYGEAREHSRKPDEAFAAAETMMPNVRRVELFSRQSRNGWDTWGREATKFDNEPKRKTPER